MNRVNTKRFLGGVLLLLLWNLLSSQSTHIGFETLSIRDGLSQSVVLCIIQDHKGFMWFGTQDGLNRYDGLNFKVYKHNPHDPTSISHNHIRAICRDKDGSLWIGTEGGGLNRFFPENETFTRYYHEPDNPDSISQNEVFSICQDKDGIMWFGTWGEGLNRYDPVLKHFTRFKNDPENPGSLSDNHVWTIVEDSRGKLWIGTFRGGLNCFDTKTGEFVRYQHDTADPDSLGDNTVFGICEDENGDMWIGTGSSGLDRYHLKTKKFSHFKHIPSDIYSISHNEIMSVAKDRSGDIWIGTWGGGVNRFDHKKSRFYGYTNQVGQQDCLSSSRIYDLFLDRSGVMWVGTKEGGVNKFSLEYHKFLHFKNDPRNPRSLRNNKVYAICEDKSGVVWVGTDGAGISRMDPEFSEFRPITKKTSTGVSLMNKEVMSILEDNGGDIWIGTNREGLFCYKQKSNRLVQFKHLPDNPKSISCDKIYTLFEDVNNTLWVGTNTGGLNRYNPSDNTFVRYLDQPKEKNQMQQNVIMTICDGEPGFLWVGTLNGGLCHFNKEDGTYKLYTHLPDDPAGLNSNDILTIHGDREGNLWLGTYGGGINKFHLESGVITKYLDIDGLPNNSVYGILEDKNGFLWLSTNGGLSRFDPKSDSFRNFDQGDGLQANEFNQGSYCIGPSGKMYFGGINGFNVFQPEEIQYNPHHPSVVIVGIQILNKNIPKLKSISFMNQLELSYRDYSFSFEFASLDYHQPDKNRYKYMLEGFKDEWLFTNAKKPLANFTNLNPGRYVFRVMGTNNDGVWSEKCGEISIIIKPPLWKTWWFKFLMVVVFAFVSYWGIGLIKKYLYLIRFWEKHVYVGNFKLLQKIASGGMGTVYKAQNLSDKTEVVALKILREELFADELNRKRFKQEGAIIDHLDHPNIVKIIERGEHKQKLYLAMELLEGKNLSEIIRQESPIPVPVMIEMMTQISEGLTKIHAKRIVHRDLKPANIMVLSNSKNGNIIKLLDFGLAKMDFQSRITQTGMVMGTIDYMSPEQVRYSEYSTASDIYSLGIIFYEMVSGERPFKGETSAQIMKYILNSDPIAPIKIRPDIPINLDGLIRKMISKDDKNRPVVLEVLDTLKKMKNDLGL